ncbi:RNA pseudouridine synthase [bacterium]|nr:RNA pseudouridine synthase [bacterium]
MSNPTIAVLFQNSHAVIVDKPSGWLSVPGRDAKDERPIVGRTLETQLNTKIYPVHRLDAEVSGLMLFSLSGEFHKEANQLFENQQIKKTYQAFTSLGSFIENEKLIWKSKILRGKKRAYEADYGKPSITHAMVVQKNANAMEWRLNPITGRAHQLRFELTKHNCPIIGDTLYGSTVAWIQAGIALRAIKIDFPEDFASRWSLPAFFKSEVLLQFP